MGKKSLIGIFICALILFVFVGNSIIPAIAKNIEKISQPTSSGNWLYVGGSGPNNYTKIQDAVDNASDGDTIQVYSGIYNENIFIEKTLTLEGENKDTTIINGGKNHSTIAIFSDNVQIMGFTMTNGSWRNAVVDIYAAHCRITNTVILDCLCGIRLHTSHENTVDNNIIRREVNHGIELIQSENNHITKNYITNTSLSIQLEESNGNTISNNIFTRNQYSIWLDTSHNNSIIENTITISDEFCLLIKQSNNNIIMKNYIYDNKGTGILLDSSQGNRIQESQISNNPYGIILISSVFNLVKLNEITNNEYGVILEEAYLNLISKNNIYDNKQNALFRNAWVNHWSSNYWKTLCIGPKIIQGKLFKWVQSGWGYKQIDILTLYKCDWHPAKEPYNIPE